MNISICCPSYKRPVVKTLEYIPSCKVYVAPEEADEYRKYNNSQNIVVCDEGIQGNLCRVRNYILRNEFKNGADVVCIVDDDMSGLYLWQKGTVPYTFDAIKVKTEDIVPLLEKYSLICKDLGYKFWGAQCNKDKMSYSQMMPFSFSKYIGGPFQVFLKGNECYYDERLPLKEDYDMTLQQCNRYRGCLRVNFLFYDVKQSEQPGGCATYRTLAKEIEQFKLLQKKWGSDIVREDTSNKGRTKKQKRFDYNPIIKVPIKGV